MFLLGAGTWAKAAQQDLADETDKVSQEEQQQMQQELLSGLDFSGVQDSLNEILGKNNLSLGQAVKDLLTGKIPITLENLGEIVKNALFQEIGSYRKTAAYLLVIIIASAVFMNFVTVFDKGQIADISYYMMYLLMVTLLMKVFSSMTQVAQGAVSSVLTFMEAMLPVCIAAIYLVTGSLTAMGFYQLTLLAVTGVQWMMNYVLLPAVQIYVILLFINQMMKEDYLSKMAELVKTAILWALKTMIALLFGMQAIQTMIAPTVDQMKTSVVNKAVSVIPGIGNAYEMVAETVLGSALLLKNAVGIAGVVSLVFLCLIPVAKLVCGVLLYRTLGAVAQPVTDKRVAECIDSVAEGGELLLKIVLYAGILFIVSLAMITVMVRVR